MKVFLSYNGEMCIWKMAYNILRWKNLFNPQQYNKGILSAVIDLLSVTVKDNR